MIIKLLSIVAITVAVASMFMMSSSFVGTSFADKGGKPNDNALNGDSIETVSKPCDNWDNKRYTTLDEKIDEEEGNDHPGLSQAHENHFDGKGVDGGNC